MTFYHITGKEEDGRLKPKSGVRISQCMIVKNESKNIEKALSWGKKFMEEQIVVDTGSTDGTPELAEKMGAKVLFYPWRDDFALAKNYAIEQAKGDWIVFMDADEYPAPGDEIKIPLLLEQIQGRDFDGVSTGWQQIDDEGRIVASGTQVRIFRNLPDLRYRRRIHEQLVSTEGRPLRLGDAVADISIFHTGYQKAAIQEKGSNERNRKLILAELKEHPEDSEMLGYMGDECFGVGEIQEAKDWYYKAIRGIHQELPENDQRSAATFSKLLQLLVEEEALEEMEPVYRQAVKALPKEADFDYMVALYYYRKGRFQEACDSIEQALGKLNQYGNSNRGLYLSADLSSAYQILVGGFYETGQKEKCVNQAVSYLNYMPEDMAVLAYLLKALSQPTLTEGGMEQIVEFLGKLYDFSSLRSKLLVTKCARACGCEMLGCFMEKRLFTQEEQNALGIR